MLPLNMIWSWLLPRRIFICVRARTRTHTRIRTRNDVVSNDVVDAANGYDEHPGSFSGSSSIPISSVPFPL